MERKTNGKVPNIFRTPEYPPMGDVLCLPDEMHGIRCLKHAIRTGHPITTKRRVQSLVALLPGSDIWRMKTCAPHNGPKSERNSLFLMPEKLFKEEKFANSGNIEKISTSYNGI